MRMIDSAIDGFDNLVRFKEEFAGVPEDVKSNQAMIVVEQM